MTPLFQKNDEPNKENYHPVSALFHASKIFEIVLNQIKFFFFFKSKFFPLLTGFRKNHSTHNALLTTVKKWKNALDIDKKVGTIYMDQSKAFDTLNHTLLLAKLNPYGCYGIWTHNRLVSKQTLNHLAKVARCLALEL